MRRFLSRRPSLRLLAAPILLLAAFTVVGLMTDWIDWNTSKNCAVDKSSLSSAKFNSQREIRQRDEAGPNGATAHWREDSDRAYARSINESSFSSSRVDVCRSVTASRADIDTMDVYPTLNFQVGIDCRLTINRWLLSGIFLFFFQVRFFKYSTSAPLFENQDDLFLFLVRPCCCSPLYSQLEAGIHAQEGLLGLVARKALQRLQEG